MEANIYILVIVITGYLLLYNLAMFIAAKIFGVRVEKFFIWYDVKFALFKIKIGETIFGMGWIPLGGYLKLSGMSDDSIDGDFTILPHYFLHLSSVKQAIVCVVGPLSTLITGMGVYAYYNAISMTLFFMISTLMVALILVAFFGITEIAKRIRMKSNTMRKSRYYMVSIFLLLLLLTGIAFLTNQIAPLQETIQELINGERFRFLVRPYTKESIISLISGMGVIIFFINMIPLSSLIGIVIAKAFYIAFTGDTSNDITDKYETIFLVLSLIPMVLYVYLLYKFLI